MELKDQSDHQLKRRIMKISDEISKLSFLTRSAEGTRKIWELEEEMKELREERERRYLEENE